jgi:acyl carrier protein
MKSNETTVLTVVQIIVDKLGIDQNQLSYKASFSDDLGVDSLDTYELLMTLEKRFELKINEDESEKLTTVGSVIEYIEDKVSVRDKFKTQKEHRAEIIFMNHLKEETTNNNLLQVHRY